MTLILDSGGVSALAGQRARLAELRRRELWRRELWPAQVPAVVLTEVFTGDHRRDFHVNQLLRMCQILGVDEQLARNAALLRTRSGRAATIAATDAIVAALAVGQADPIVLTSDPDDLAALVADHSASVTIARA
ncbi:MAG TPA: PIN domain-containing protein [Microthrixaceae bacterium]|nr:PIN domain-containing protein [Microthrixaceae bacterium]HMT24352.1 PIN domain-containing protein [Microthrixaceae bacterium]HMT61286.1 PIN domain-containing protein [Microthrixaceae bacterium]